MGCRVLGFLEKLGLAEGKCNAGMGKSSPVRLCSVSSLSHQFMLLVMCWRGGELVLCLSECLRICVCSVFLR